MEKKYFVLLCVCTIFILGGWLLSERVWASTTTDGLVGYWKFDETSAGSFTDSSGHGNTGTGGGTGGDNNTPQPSTDVDSGFSFANTRSLGFDVTDDYVDVGSSSSLNPSTELTVTAWVKPTSTAPVLGSIVTRNRNASTRAYEFYLRDDGTDFRAEGFYNGGTASLVPSTYDLNINEWSHVAFVMESTGSTLYQNAVSVATSTGVTMNTVTDQTMIGGRDDTSFSFGGFIDDVRIYDRALSSTEISALAAKTHPAATWDGSSSTDWEVAANWDINAIPDNYTNVTIADTVNDPVFSTNIELADLTINTDTTLDLSSFNLQVNDNGTFTNNGTLQLQGGNTLTSFTNDTDSGTVDYTGTGTYTELIAGDSYHNLTFSGAGSWTLDALLDVNNILSLAAGTLDVSSASDFGITIGGNWSNTGGTFNEQEGTVTFDGSGAQTLTGETFYNLTINNSSASPDDSTDVDSSSAVTASSTLTVTDGQFQPTTGSDFNIVSIGASGILKPDASANITVSGNWTNNGAFTHNSGTVTFDGTNQTLAGSSTFNNFSKTESADDSTDEVLTFTDGTTQTIASLFTIDGRDDDDRVNLVSSNPGSSWSISPTTFSVDFSDVTDSTNTSGTDISCTSDSCINGGGNSGWDFDTVAPNISSVASSAITQTEATITWATDEASSSQVEYGETVSYGNETTEIDTAPRVTSHSVSLSSLTCGTLYHYRVKSTDASDNLATGSDTTLTTSACDVSSSGGNISGSSPFPSSHSRHVPSPTEEIDEVDAQPQENDAKPFPRIVPPFDFEGAVEIIPLPDDKIPVTDDETQLEPQPSIDEPILPSLTPESLTAIDTISFAITDTFTSIGEFFVSVGRTALSSVRALAFSFDELIVATGRSLYAVGTTATTFFEAISTFIATVTTQTLAVLTNQQQSLTDNVVRETYRQATTRSATTIEQALRHTGQTIRESGESVRVALNPPPLPDPRIPEHLRDHRYEEVQVRIALADGTPLKGAQLTLLSEPKEAVTDERGSASFTDVEIGEHTLIIAFGKFKGEQQLFFVDDVPRLLVNVTPALNEGINALAFTMTIFVVAVGVGIVIWNLSKRRFSSGFA